MAGGKINRKSASSDIRRMRPWACDKAVPPQKMIVAPSSVPTRQTVRTASATSTSFSIMAGANTIPSRLTSRIFWEILSSILLMEKWLNVLIRDVQFAVFFVDHPALIIADTTTDSNLADIPNQGSGNLCALSRVILACRFTKPWLYT